MTKGPAQPWPLGEPVLPGWVPPAGGRRLTTFSAADLSGRWALDFHTPRGIVPLAIALVDDLTAGAIAAADELGLPGGLQARLVGCHVYLGVAPRPGQPVGGSPSPAGTTYEPFPADLAAYARGFRAHWAAISADLSAELDALDAVDLTALSDAELLAQWRRAGALHERAWRIHFAVMYRLLTVHEYYVAVCRRHGVPEVDAARMVEGEAHVIGEGDRAMRALAEAAVTGGFANVLLRTPTTRVLKVLRREPRARDFLAELARVQSRYGRRTSALFDVESTPWSVDATPLLALVRSALVAGPRNRPWGPADARALAESVLAGLDPQAAAEVRSAWELAVAGNASWWSEEHNHLIDLRAHLPAADVAREVARRGRRPLIDVWHLLAEELEDLLVEHVRWEGLQARVADRAAFTAACRLRRRSLPAALGVARNAPEDVVFRQVMNVGGAIDHLGDALLQGYGVSPGVGRGSVRVVRHAEDIILLQPGDVLVCAATSPSWTPAFDRIAAAVCDGGGLLTHAAIISREYGVPCVVATFTGTTTLRDGDVVEVDGGTGTVRLLWRNPAARTSRGDGP